MRIVVARAWIVAWLLVTAVSFCVWWSTTTRLDTPIVRAVVAHQMPSRSPRGTGWRATPLPASAPTTPAAKDPLLAEPIDAASLPDGDLLVLDARGTVVLIDP